MTDSRTDVLVPTGERLRVDDVMEFWHKVSTDNSQRNGEYDRARRYVDGELWGDQRYPTPYNRYHLTANYLMPFTMKHVQLLVGRMPGIQVIPAGSEYEHREHAEKLEGVIYAFWDDSKAQTVFQRVAWDSYVLRRGLINYGWDATKNRYRFYYVTPDDYYPEYDGDETYRAVYVSRRHVDALRREYPDMAHAIEPDAIGVEQISGMDQPRLDQSHYVTVYDYYDKWGRYARVANDQMLTQGLLRHPEPEVPFIEFPCYPSNGNREPKNGIEQLVELNQHLNALVSQKSDIIKKYANPTVLNKQSGNSAEEVRRATSAEGSVLNVHKDGDVSFLNWDGSVPAIDEQIQLILDMMFDISGKPRSSFGQTITNQSGVVTNLALTPTLQSNEYHETIWGAQLAHLNRRGLQITEEFGKGTTMQYRGVAPAGADGRGKRIVDLEFDPGDINGWYENEIKWPSAIRVDDPVYIQNIISRLTSDPPAISLYTALEELGVEDVEEEIDRILEQKEDPRLSPETAAAGMASAAGLGDTGLAGGLVGAAGPAPPALPTGTPPPPPDVGLDGQALQAGASPYTEELS